MISSFSRQDYSSFSKFFNDDRYPKSSKLLNYTSNSFQNLSYVQPKNQKIHKKYSSNILTDLKFGIKNYENNEYSIDFPKVLNINSSVISNSNILEKMNSHNKNITGFNFGNRLYTSENINYSNLNTSQALYTGNYNYSTIELNPMDEIKERREKFPKFYTHKRNNAKTPFVSFLKSKYSGLNEINDENQNILNFNVNNSDLLSKDKNDEDNNIEAILNRSSDDLTIGNNFDTFVNDIEDEPKFNSKLSEFEIIRKIGKGAEGKIYEVLMKKNNKRYALKKCKIIYPINIEKRKNDNKALRNFIDTTGCDGIIKPYATICLPNPKGYTDCYEIMELAEKDWEKEILKRKNNNQFYSEFELMQIFRNLINIFSSLQKNHITHRDIKPQNIMLVKDKMKICDFGNARVLKGHGIIIQRIRGSELYMSPKIFNAYQTNKQNVKHNAYKSDVYSLVICFFIAASLCYDGPNYIRQMTDMNKIKDVLDYNLAKKYSPNLVNLIYTMLEIDESKFAPLLIFIFSSVNVTLLNDSSCLLTPPLSPWIITFVVVKISTITANFPVRGP